MASCPYTWFKNLFDSPRPDGSEATYLRVAVIRDNETKVDVALPARSARWLIELIPSDVITKIREEGIPIDDIQSDLAGRSVLVAENIFTLKESNRTVNVWLE